MKLLISILFLSSGFLACAADIPKVEPGKPLPSNLFVELAKKVNPAVVNISTKVTSNYSGQDMPQSMEELLEQFFGRRFNRYQQRRPTRPQEPEARPHSLGTGFIISSDGMIITNSHVVDKADLIQVQLTEGDEKLYDAEVIGKDPTTDIALIKIKAKKKLPIVKFGTSSDLQVGEWVAAFGNPFGHGHSMTKGIVSAIGRNLDDINLLPFIQTDASINPGNSGGPLVNVKGEVIGVNTAIDARAQGIGFAIPIDEVKTVVAQLKTGGSIERGFLGVQLADVSQINNVLLDKLQLKTTKGALIVNVVPGEAAELSGLKEYDFITKFNGKKVKNSSNLSRIIKQTPINKKVSLEYIRNGKTKLTNVRLGTQNNENTVARNSNPDVNKRRAHKKPSKDELLETYGMSVSDLNKSLKKDFDISNNGKHKAVITRVVGYSQAAKQSLRPGDIIYEVNKSPVFSASDVTKKLLKSGSHMLRVKRGTYFFLIQLQS